MTNQDLQAQLEERARRLRFLGDVATMARDTSSVDEAYAFVLERVCRQDSWICGHVFDVGEDGTVEATDIRYVAESADGSVAEWLDERARSSEDDLPTRVVETRRPHGVRDLRETTPLGEAAHDVGLRSAVAFPVLLQAKVRAVVECYSSQPVDVDTHLLETLGNVGAHLGRVVERHDTEERLIHLTERGQHRLGEEIHDALGQQLTALGMIAKTLQDRLESEDSDAVELASRLREEIHSTHQQLRTLARNLTPMVGAKDLGAALLDLLDYCRRLYGLDCDTEIEEIETTEEIASSLYRIAREALNNAAFHAEATKVQIRLQRTDEALVLEVRDDGLGMEAVPQGEAEGLGMRLMRHRAELIRGELELESTPGRGTVVRCRVPDAE